MYRRDQLGYVILISMMIAMLLILASSLKYFENISIIVTALLVLSLVLFYKLSVRVNDKYIIAVFGIGLIRKRFLLKDIRSAKAVRNKWWYGFGIHLTPHGWLYNVSGLGAVELTLKNGRHVRIGTKDPQGLAKYISGKL